MTERQMPVVDIFLDEAGYTGPDLINREQPVFVLASTVVDDGEAQGLLNSCFDRSRPTEIKHSRLVRSRRGRAQILDFLRQLNPTGGKIAFYGVHKEYVLLAFLIDFWLEPLMHLEGVNLYAQGANISVVNVAYLTLGATLGLDGRRELLKRFQVMTRDRTRFAYETFWDSLREAARTHQLIEEALGLLLVAEQRLGYRHLIRLPTNLIDLGDYGLLRTISYWQRALSDHEFTLVHDRSAMIERHRAVWDAILDPANPSAVVGQDRRIISFPFPVRELRTADSRDPPRCRSWTLSQVLPARC